MEIRTYRSDHGLIIIAGTTFNLVDYVSQLSARFGELKLEQSLPAHSTSAAKIVALLKKQLEGEGETVFMPRTRGDLVCETAGGEVFGPARRARLTAIVGVDGRFPYRSQLFGRAIKSKTGHIVRFWPSVLHEHEKTSNRACVSRPETLSEAAGGP